MSRVYFVSFIVEHATLTATTQGAKTGAARSRQRSPRAARVAHAHSPIVLAVAAVPCCGELQGLHAGDLPAHQRSSAAIGSSSPRLEAAFAVPAPRAQGLQRCRTQSGVDDLIGVVPVDASVGGEVEPLPEMTRTAHH